MKTTISKVTNTLTKSDAVKAVSTLTGQSHAVVESVIDSFLKGVTSALAYRQRVEFRGFGIWEVRMSKERIGRNPKHPEAGTLRIPSRAIVRFKAGKDLKAALDAVILEDIVRDKAYATEEVIVAQPVN